MEKSKQRLLVHAEPFGFGPTAAIASFYPHLRERFENIAFIGRDHTMDLQQDLGYDNLYDTSGLGVDEEQAKLADIAKSHDIFMTAMDFAMASCAMASGLRTCIYDALTWYWPKIREEAKQSDLYLAQDFLGVRQRLQEESMTQAHIVSPIIPDVGLPRGNEHVLVNLGGLKNPSWEFETVAHYARKIVNAVLACVPEGKKIVVATSNGVREYLSRSLEKGDERLEVNSFNRDEMRTLIANSEYAFMTPGLGNIYDVARYASPTIWLPSANDSQGLQLELIAREGLVDGSVDWRDLLSKGIDYRADQSQVLRQIVTAINELNTFDLAFALEQQLNNLTQLERSRLEALIDRFGTNGEEQVAEHVYKFAQSL